MNNETPFLFPQLPSREDLEAVFGFPPPQPFLRMMQAAWCSSDEDEPDLGGFFEEPCGIYLSCERYQQTPMELVPIGSAAGDGEHIGYVIHAPELPAEDYPVAIFCPMDKYGLKQLGADTRSAFEAVMSQTLATCEEIGGELEANDLRRFELVAKALRIEPDPGKALWPGTAEEGDPLTPVIPDGYEYYPSSDGAGVLAPVKTFSPKTQLPEQRESTPASWFFEEARGALSAGFPGTALLYAREGHWQRWYEDTAVMREFLELMRECYTALGRPMLARAVTVHIAEYCRQPA